MENTKINEQTIIDFYNLNALDYNLGSLGTYCIKAKTNNINDKSLIKLIDFIAYGMSSHSPSKSHELNGLKFGNSYSNEVNDVELLVLFDNIEKFNNFYCRARICDVLWSRKVNGKHPLTYLESTINFYKKEIQYTIENNIIDNFNTFPFSLARYITLSTQLGSNPKQQEIAKNCFDYIKEKIFVTVKKQQYYLTELILRECQKEENFKYFSLGFVNYNNLKDVKNLNKYNKIFEETIMFYHNQKNFDILEFFYNNLFKFLNEVYKSKLLDDDVCLELLKKTKYKIIKNYIAIAGIRKDNQVKYNFIQKAVVFAENNKLKKERFVKKLKFKLSSLKKEFNFAEISYEYKVPREKIEEIIKSVSSKTFEEKIRLLLYNVFGSLPTKENFEITIAKMEKENPILDFVPTQVLDINLNKKELDISPYDIDYLNSLSFIHALNLINPILENIRQENYLYPEFFKSLVMNNYFIPQGHELFFEKGVYYFLNDNRMESMALLMPQIEESLRYLVKQKQSTTKQLSKDSREQEEVDISKLLDLCEQHNLLNKKICFYFKKILDERGIRHNFAHGFNPQEDFGSPIYDLLFCLVLLILVFGNSITE